MLTDKTLGVLGFGKLGEAVAVGLVQRGGVPRERIVASVRRSDSAERARARTGIDVSTDSAAVVERADILLIAVKPQTVGELLTEVGAAIRPDQLVISAAASVGIDVIQRLIPAEVPVVRVMPNTPCLLGAGMSVLSPGPHAGAEHMRLAQAVFDAVGRTVTLDERHLDAVTGLSGSGPAYLYVVIESLAEAGVKLGIPRETATLLSAQSVLGAARMVLERGEHPALLKDAVTTPAGCTIDGLLELEEGKLRVTLVKAVVKAAQRSTELASGLR